MTKITKSIVSITLTTIMITSTMAIKANAANTNQELKWRNDTYYSTSTFNAYNKTFSTYVKNGSKKETKVPGYNSGYGDVTFSLKGTNNSIYAILSKSGNTKEKLTLFTKIGKYDKKTKKTTNKEKAGETAGKIWSALNETEGLTAKQIKKATKLVDKDLFLGLGWLLREDKISTQEVEGELFVKLV